MRVYIIYQYWPTIKWDFINQLRKVLICFNDFSINAYTCINILQCCPTGDLPSVSDGLLAGIYVELHMFNILSGAAGKVYIQMQYVFPS